MDLYFFLSSGLVILLIDLSTRQSHSVEIRLVNGNTPFEGRVEVRQNGSTTWKSMCTDKDTGWNLTVARAACKQLGFNTVMWHDRNFGVSDLNYTVCGVSCNPFASTLDECDINFGENGMGCDSCGSTLHEGTGVTCYFPEKDFLGRYKEDNIRIFPIHMALPIPKYDVTIQKCIKECRDQGKTIAVLPSADECYCGDDSVDYWRYGEAIPGLPILPDTQAVKYNTLQCSGDNGTTAFMQGCGGDWQLDVYNTSFGACGGDYTDSSGYIYSPNFPGNYTNEQSCTWTITVDPGHIVKLTTLMLRLQDNDMVIVKDGIEDHSSTISTFTGYSLPQPLNSSSNTLRIEMITDNTGNDLGFVLQYEVDEITVSTPVQQSTQMTSDTTKVTSMAMTPGRQSPSAVTLTAWRTNEMTLLTDPATEMLTSKKTMGETTTKMVTISTTSTSLLSTEADRKSSATGFGTSPTHHESTGKDTTTRYLATTSGYTRMLTENNTQRKQQDYIFAYIIVAVVAMVLLLFILLVVLYRRKLQRKKEEERTEYTLTTVHDNQNSNSLGVENYDGMISTQAESINGGNLYVGDFDDSVQHAGSYIVNPVTLSGDYDVLGPADGQQDDTRLSKDQPSNFANDPGYAKTSNYKESSTESGNEEMKADPGDTTRVYAEVNKKKDLTQKLDDEELSNAQQGRRDFSSEAERSNAERDLESSESENHNDATNDVDVPAVPVRSQLRLEDDDPQHVYATVDKSEKNKASKNEGYVDGNSVDGTRIIRDGQSGEGGNSRFGPSISQYGTWTTRPRQDHLVYFTPHRKRAAEDD
ncbi:uncharacterized protein [Ptychodera flava]|uniref:uncharacterized protein n=1 Tax=Ptychodera flava TaxID=63121 RepID=UPI00396A956A